MKTQASRVAICDPWHQEVRGWAGFDPSNAMITGKNICARARPRQRRYFPLAGIIVRSRAQHVDVKVNVVPRA
jgi:hypothetical protein